MILNNGNLKLAIQKEGRLTEETLGFLRQSGLEFESYKQRLFSVCRNFPLEIVYVRDDDIPNFVASGTVDLGIVGQNLLYEQRVKVKKLLNLRYGFCSLIIAVPKDSNIRNITDLKNKKIATSYPNSAKNFLNQKKIDAEIVPIKGSVEVTPMLGVAEVIVDLTSTGSTLALNDLRVLAKIYDSEAVLITYSRLERYAKKKIFVEKMIGRFKGFLSAKEYKYVLMNVGEKFLYKIKNLPAIKSSIVSIKSGNNSFNLQCVMKEEILWEMVNQFKKKGLKQIFILPVEKIIL